MAKKPNTKLIVFSWSGVDRKGAKVSGEQEGPNPAFVRAMLRRQGIKPKKIKRKAQPLFSFDKPVKPKDIAIASRQLATMVGAGIPLAQGLGAIAKNEEHKKLSALFTTIRQEVESGTNMSTAIRKFPKHFDRLFVSLVGVGEQSGTLDHMLDKISFYMEKIEILKGKIKSAMFYPIMVVFVAIAVTAVLLLFVIPAFDELFKSVDVELPTLTRFLVDLSASFQEWWWKLLLITIAGCMIIAYFYRRSSAFQFTVDRFKLRIPVIGGVIKQSTIARISRTLATMFGAGVPLVDSLESVAHASSNRVFQNGMLQVRDEVSSGRRLEQAMQETKLFPNMAMQMVATGEETGELEVMLNKVADFYEREVDDAVAAMSSLIEPIMIVVIGVLVGGMVIAMYLPIFKLASVF